MADILTERDGDVAIVTLNRPTRRNGMTVAMLGEMDDALRAVARSDARVLLLHGAGGHFSVGADMDGPRLPADGRSKLETIGDTFGSAALLHTMPQVTIAAIEGACAGGALGWACACDFRFAAADARFSTAFLAIGASGDMGLAWSLQRIVGGARARELLFFPDRFDARQALDWGIVTRLHEPAALADEAMAAARRLAQAPAFTLRMMKANMLSAEALSFGDYLDIEVARQMGVAEGGSIRAGFAAFRDSRTAAS